jgi:heme oxygenase
LHVDRSMAESWMSNLLAKETAEHHQGADGARLALMEKVSAAKYRACLLRVFCFEAPVEEALSRTPGIDHGLLATHAKTALLARDLRALGVDTSIEPSPAFEDAGQALGWLYVLNRNTLFHGLLTRQLTTLIPDDIRIAGSYLRAFDGQLGARMRELASVLDRYGSRRAIAARIVEGAHEAFKCQRRWYACAPQKVPPRMPAVQSAA